MALDQSFSFFGGMKGGCRQSSIPVSFQLISSSPQLNVAKQVSYRPAREPICRQKCLFICFVVAQEETRSDMRKVLTAN